MGRILSQRQALSLAVTMIVLAAGCGPTRPPPPWLSFEGLPVTGSLADALKAGFTNCIPDNADMRCRRSGVMVLGNGPYNAAVDLVGGDGAGGFDQLTLWHDRDQNAVQAVTRRLVEQGWRSCFTGKNDRGDQAIYTRDGAPVLFSMDLSYFGKRRLRILPADKSRAHAC